jgi:tRNA-modifying protein YgfZ
MSSVNPTRTAVTTALADHQVVALRGPDAVAFAQAQLANDVAALGDGQWQWNCLLTAQGRVVALMLLLRISAAELLLLAPHARAAEIATRLRPYVLRRKVEVLPEPAWHVVGELGGAAAGGSVAAGGTAIPGDGKWRIELGGFAGRALNLTPEDAGTSQSALDAWQRADVRDALPWISDGVVEEFIPQALGLGRLPAYSLAKGCYPGQEIVARTHYLGRSKRGLLRFRGAGSAPPPCGERLVVGGSEPAEPAAMVVSAVSLGREIQGLCVSQKELAPGTPLESTLTRYRFSFEPV